MKPVFLIARISFLFVLSFSSCMKDDPSDDITVEKLSGFIQKGPFMNGTSILVSELNANLRQTGKLFTTQIKDNEGAFELADLQLSSPYIQLKADGFYFNEVTGEPSKSPITLYALGDVSSMSALNVNVLTTLEKDRVGKLVAEGLPFTIAKKKAMEEILAIFGIRKTDIPNPEMLDINKGGDDNAILLAISAILQGDRSEAELSELLADLSADISTDGKLDSQAFAKALITHARALDAGAIRTNLVARYQEMGVSIEIPEFEKYIEQFLDSSMF